MNNKFFVFLLIVSIFLIQPFYLHSEVTKDVSSEDTKSPDLLRPKIVSFQPLSGFTAGKGYKGTEVLISGSNFALAAKRNTVTFGRKIARVIEATKDSILVRVPYGAKTNRIRVKTPAGRVVSQNKFEIMGKPVILSFSPSEAAIGDEVTITGFNFADANIQSSAEKKRASNILDKGFLKVKFGNLKAEVTSATENEIKAIVPDGALNGKIKVITPAGTTRSQKEFVVNESPGKEAVSINVGDSVTETLDSTDNSFYGIFYDVYKFEGKALQTLTIKMSSNDFDTYLYLISPDDAVLAQDDDSGGGTDSQITITLPEDGTYSIYANSAFEGAEGSYELSVIEPSASLLGAISGTLSLQPYITLSEEEPNDSLQTAQQVNSPPVNIFGSASSSDPGYTVSDTQDKVQDIYSMTVDGAIEITLESSSQDADFDLFLLGRYGHIISKSEARGNGLKESLVYQPLSPRQVFIGIKAFSGSGNYILTVDRPKSTTSLPNGGLKGVKENFVPGEFVVKFRKQYSKTGFMKKPEIGSFKMAGPATDGLALLKLDDAAKVLQSKNKAAASGKRFKSQNISNEDLKTLTIETLKKLRKSPEVEMADLNYIRKAYSTTPDDKYYSLQWDFSTMNLPQAWDLIKGNDNVIVAVIDTGIASKHLDLQGRLVQGYDFISDQQNALDGDGIDPNPEDPGDDSNHKKSSFHGTHVAGTIGAATNNGTGVAGVTWKGKIMPLRVLGAWGGTDFDTLNACLYAAGLPNSSGTTPSKKATVINMSLGGAGYSQVFQDRINEILKQGVTIVAAAGNENTDTLSYPASYSGVISVGAIDASLKRAPYSNYGPNITIVAPGGNTSADVNNDGYQDGVLSTLSDDSGKFFYGFYQGTSMASPHVAGVVALIQAALLDKGLALLTPAEVENIVTSTAMDLGTTGKDNTYGYGLVDAQRCVEKAIESIRSSSPAISVSAEKLNFENKNNQLTFSVTNSGGGILTVNSIEADASWLVVEPSTGTVPEKGELIVTVSVDSTGLADGAYSAAITISSNGGNATIDVSMHVGKAFQRDIGPIYLVVVDKDTLKTIKSAETDLDKNLSYEITSLLEGDYFVIAGTDRNNDGFICDDGEACGAYPTLTDPQLVSVKANQDTQNISFEVIEQFSILSSGLLKQKPKAVEKGFRIQSLRK
ncbi:MAG: hypothetical protein A2149_00080 [Candidatus Schekmanbacteria bacterium RBG_16_38_11]|uniref:Peptidase S8/S53 domain-containing protein n=1 Tax=Candidatus Schekmanbacteria bacterium RBG_16_38_11 TaxID=1817880 RepID=A0A1F7RZD6_9BACT|nr:MAG: hypothetical protein A2149_00080 [Candidatus Schekmanbacteria bacterium RBG_16_38_11]